MLSLTNLFRNKFSFNININCKTQAKALSKKKILKKPHVSTAVMQRRMREAIVILLGCLALFFFIALLSYHVSDHAWSVTGKDMEVLNAGGKVGAWFADILLYLFGFVAYLFPFGCLLLGWRIFSERKDEHLQAKQLIYLRIFGFVLVLFSATALFSLHISASINYMPFTAGGILGSLLGHALVSILNSTGTSLLLLALFFGGLTLATGISWIKVMDLMGAGALYIANTLWKQILNLRANRASRISAPPLPNTKSTLSVTQPILAPIARAIPKPQISTELPQIQPSKRAQQEAQGTKFETQKYEELPALSLLDAAKDDKNKGHSKEILEHLSQLVETKLNEFGVTANVVAVNPGPVITRFELDLSAGTKVNRLTNLQKDLARALSVPSVRIVEIIPGKTYVGLEIPNENREVVRLSAILAADIFEEAKSPLSLALGKDIAGKPYVVDLEKMPHLMVAGTTGSGKSVGLNAMLLSILYKSTPEEVRLIMINPKMLELSVYNDIPHLLTPVITDMKEAANALRWAINEMERRYRLMSELGVRNLAGYNEKLKNAIDNKQPLLDPLWPTEAAGEAPNLEILPRIVILVDEFADMMIVVGKKVEELIVRLAQKARAAGIHLIIATQRPSVDVITGVIKANIPARISFQVISRIDSRTILDQQGAEQLLGHGDMLYMGGGMSVPERVHGAFVSDEEVHKVVKDWKSRGKPNYLMEIIETITMPGEKSTEREEGGLDPLYDEAVQIVLETQRASISNVQRRLKIGYNRAARILEEMEAQGVVSPMESNGSREILVQNGGN